MTSGQKMRELRGDRTKEEVAAAINVTCSSYTKYERDERVPRDEVKIRIANYYKKSVGEIFFADSEHYMCS